MLFISWLSLWKVHILQYTQPEFSVIVWVDNFLIYDSFFIQKQMIPFIVLDFLKPHFREVELKRSFLMFILMVLKKSLIGFLYSGSQ